jgi:hypothetical protein
MTLAPHNAAIRVDGDRIAAIGTYLSDVDGMNAFFTPRPQ